jgi:hypothetical protein
MRSHADVSVSGSARRTLWAETVKMREHIKSKIQEMTQPAGEAAFDFWAAEVDRRRGELERLVLSRMEQHESLVAEVYAISVKPRDFLGRNRFLDYLHELGGRVARRRAEYRVADESLLHELRRSLASFGIRYRRFAAEMGEDYEKFDKSAHHWKYADDSKIRIALGSPHARRPDTVTQDNRDEDIPFEELASAS